MLLYLTPTAKVQLLLMLLLFWKEGSKQWGLTSLSIDQVISQRDRYPKQGRNSPFYVDSSSPSHKCIFATSHTFGGFLSTYATFVNYLKERF